MYNIGLLYMILLLRDIATHYRSTTQLAQLKTAKNTFNQNPVYFSYMFCPFVTDFLFLVFVLFV